VSLAIIYDAFAVYFRGENYIYPSHWCKI